MEAIFVLVVIYFVSIFVTHITSILFPSVIETTREPHENGIPRRNLYGGSDYLEPGDTVSDPHISNLGATTSKPTSKVCKRPAFLDDMLVKRRAIEFEQLKLAESKLFDSLIDYNSHIESGIYMSTEAKLEYLLSPEWHSIRNQRLVLAMHKCEFCGSTKLLNCHHVTYIRLGFENLSDIRILCESCHSRLHKLAEIEYADDGYGGNSRDNLYPLSFLTK